MTDKEIILAIGKWPRWPFLPLKKRPERPGEWPSFAYIFADEMPKENSGSVVIRKGNIYRPKFTDETISFDSIDTLLAAGWVVD